MSTDDKNPDFLSSEEEATRHPYRAPQEPTKTGRLRQFFVDRTRVLWPTFVILAALSAIGATAAIRLNGIRFPDGTSAPSGVYNVKNPEWGAIGDGVADDTAAIQSAINAAKSTNTAGTKGAVVYFPAGVYVFSSQLTLSDAKNVTLRGVGGFGIGTPAPSTTLKYTGTGSTSAINAQSTYGVVFDSMGITYSSASFTGVLIDFTHSASTFDSAFDVITNCYIGTYNQTNRSSAAALVSLVKAVSCSIQNSHLMGAAIGIQFRGANTDYSNAHNVTNCTFQDFATAAIVNAGQQTSIRNSTFENNPIIGTPTMAPAYLDNLSAEGGSETDWCMALDFSDNWVGDGDDSAYIFDTGATKVHGLTMIGNVLGNAAGTKGLHLGPISGGVIEGNALQSQITFYPATTFVGLTIQGNERESNTAAWNNVPTTGVTIFNNPYVSGGNALNDTLTLGGTGMLSFANAVSSGGSSGMDYSANSGPFKTPTGASTFGGSSNSFTSETNTISGAFNNQAVITPGLSMNNTTAATAVITVQQGPALEMIGQAWNSTAVASQTSKWAIVNNPSNGASLSSNLYFYSSENGGAYTERMRMNSGGNMIIPGQFFAGTSGGTGTINAASFNPGTASTAAHVCDSNIASCSIGLSGAITSLKGTLNLGQATVSQATNVNTGVTANGASIVITTQTATTAARTAETGFTVTDSSAVAASVVRCAAYQYSGTLFTNGQPDVDVTTVSAGSFAVRIINRDATNALNGTMKIHCSVL